MLHNNIQITSLCSQVEKPDPSNQTNARNPTTHAEEEGAYSCCEPTLKCYHCVTPV